MLQYTKQSQERKMFAQHSCNMSTRESYIRAFLASGLMLYAFISASFFLGTVAIIIFYTAYTKFCFVYYFFKINERFSKKNYYLSLLPKHRTSPVFIFDKKGKIVYENKYGHLLCKEIHSIQDLHTQNIKDIFTHNTIEKILYEYQDKAYQVEIVPITEEKLILAYFSDITEIIALNEEIEETQREVIYAMGEIGETRSKETGNHVKRVAEYSELLAKLYGLDEKEAQKLKMASPMHDIGKVGIPDAILNAPRKLTNEEFEVMKTHAQLGYDMLKHSTKPILQAAAIVAGQHHEKYDGSGYPRGLKGENIHIYGRITAVADVFDALGSERVYKKAWELEKILALFQEEKGKQFDPKLIDLFVQHLDQFLYIRKKYKDI